MWWLCGCEIVGSTGGCGGCVGDGCEEGDRICVEVCPKNGQHIVRVVLMMAMMWWLCGYDVLGLCGSCGGGVGDGCDEGDKCLEVNLELPVNEPVIKKKRKKSTCRYAEFWSTGC